MSVNKTERGNKIERANKNDAERLVADASKADANGHAISTDPAGAELNKIRSILFGDAYRELRDDYSQLRTEIEQRFASLEKSLGNRLDSQIDSVRKEAQTNFDSLNSSIESEGRTLSASVDSLEDKLRHAEEAQQHALKVVESSQDGRTSDLSQRMERTAEAIRSEQHESQQHFSGRLDAAVAGLSKAKTDRTQLAELFESIATTLRADSN